MSSRLVGMKKKRDKGASLVGGKKRAFAGENPFSDESRNDNNDEKSEDDAPPTCFNQLKNFHFFHFDFSHFRLVMSRDRNESGTKGRESRGKTSFGPTMRWKSFFCPR